MLDHVPTICRFCVPEKHLPLLLQSISNLLNTRFRSISSSSSLFPNGDGHCQSFHREKRAELLRATIIKRHLGFFFLRLHPTFLAKKKDLALDQYFRLHVLLNVRFFASYPDEL